MGAAASIAEADPWAGCAPDEALRRVKAEDDTPIVVSSDDGEHAEARLSAYATHTRPLLEHLRGRGIAFHEVEVVADLAQMDEQVAAVVARS